LHQKKGIYRVEHKLRSYQLKYEKLISNYDENFEALPLEKKATMLKGDNKEIRSELKKLNEMISEMVEARKQSKYYSYIHIVFKKLPKITNEQRDLYYSQEVKNAEKQLQNAETEFQAMSLRLQQITQPQYSEELKERNIALSHRIKKMERSKKTLEVEQSHREKKIGKVIDAGEPELLQEINRIRADITNTEKQIREVDAILERRSKALHDHQTRQDNANTEWQKIATDATTIGFDAKNPPVPEMTKNEKFKLLDEKRSALLKELNLLKSRNNYTLSDYMQRKMKFEKELTQLAQEMQGKTQYKQRHIFYLK